MLQNYRLFTAYIRNYSLHITELPSVYSIQPYLQFTYCRTTDCLQLIALPTVRASIQLPKDQSYYYPPIYSCVSQVVSFPQVEKSEGKGLLERHRHRWEDNIKPLKPNDPYRGRTAPLTSKVAFYIFIQQI